jgi:hypothetical protein
MWASAQESEGVRPLNRQSTGPNPLLTGVTPPVEKTLVFSASFYKLALQITFATAIAAGATVPWTRGSGSSSECGKRRRIIRA